MPCSPIYLHSPFSAQTVQERQNRALLLQFMLSELLQCRNANTQTHPLKFVFSAPACFFPFDWSQDVGHLNKLAEHTTLLIHAFSDMEKAVDAFAATLHPILDEVAELRRTQSVLCPSTFTANLRELYNGLKPFLIACKESENLVLFLLKRAEEIDALSGRAEVDALLRQMFPDGNYSALRERYTERCFDDQLAQFDAHLAAHE